MGDPGSQQNALLDILLNPSAEAEELPFSLLEDITKKFSDKLIIGQGGFGVVYKGVLQNEMEIAIKRLQLNGLILDDDSFHAEVNSLKNLKHKNIVRFLGYCIHTEKQEYTHNERKVLVETRRERLLCFEFLPNGAIPKEDADKGLAWPQRYQIIKGICYGLEYIHNAGYIHLDFKPDNILLDSNMVPKITDFGLSKFFDNQSTRNTMNNPGTLGYMAPEYLQQGTVSKKTDIYSLGVVILEFVTGSKGPAGIFERIEDKDDTYLLKELAIWKKKLLYRYTGQAFQQASQQVETCIKIALNCTDRNREHRRQIKQIAQILELALDPDITEAVFVKDLDSLRDMDVHPIEPWVVLSSSSGCIEILNYDTKESIGSFQASDKPVHSAKFWQGPTSCSILAGDDRGVMHYLYFETERRSWSGPYPSTYMTFSKGITSIAVHPSKTHILTSTGSSVMIWDCPEGTCVRMHHGPGYFKEVTHASFNSNDGTVFTTGCCDGTVKLWCYDYSRVAHRRPHLELRDHSGQICSISYFTCNDVCFLVTGSMDKTAKVWKYNGEVPKQSGLMLESIRTPEATLKHRDGVTATCFNPQFETIITGTNDGVVSLWCSHTYRLKRVLCFGLGRICAVSSTGKRIFISHEHGFVKVDIYSQQQL